MPSSTSTHILNAAANLLGFCLFVITSLHVVSYNQVRLVDKFTSVVAVLLTVSCGFSFIAIKTEIKKREKLMEAIANYLFLTALAGILFIILVITSNYLRIKLPSKS